MWRVFATAVWHAEFSGFANSEGTSRADWGSGAAWFLHRPCSAECCTTGPDSVHSWLQCLAQFCNLYALQGLCRNCAGGAGCLAKQWLATLSVNSVPRKCLVCVVCLTFQATLTSPTLLHGVGRCRQPTGWGGSGRCPVVSVNPFAARLKVVSETKRCDVFMM